MLIDPLFRLRSEEAQDRLLTPTFRRVLSAVAAINVPVLIFAVPADKLLVLSAAQAFASPGAAQFVNALNISLVSPIAAATGFELVNDRTAYAAGVQPCVHFSGAILVPPLWSVFAIGNFNAGGVANTVSATIFGYVTPVGNVDRSV